jgi:23S rRNA pseudouridine2605 synthase
MASERLQKLIARAGLASRRGAEALISDGRVRVNGRVAELGASADPAVDRIEVDGRALPSPSRARHLAVHKPAGYLSSAHDERGRRSVVALVDAGRDRLWPAGRLDVESEGLMILTNDGDWANRVMHPRYGNEREYAALISPSPTRAVLRQLRDGVTLEDGPARLLAARFAVPPPEVDRERNEAGAWLTVRIGEGRKREVRRLFAAVDARVERLVRTRIGPLRLTGLRSGQWRLLRPSEIAALAGERRR